MMTDHRIPNEDTIFDRAIQILRAGFAISAVLLAAGIVWSLIDRRELGTRLLPFQKLPRAIVDGDPAAIIDLGILAMMLTPVVLTLAIAWEFSKLGERRFAIASLLVLGVLVISIAISLVR